MRYELGLELDEERAMPPHRAGPDTYVTAHILVRMMQEATVNKLVGWTIMPRFLPRCPIGKFRNQPWENVEMGFLRWMIGQPDMDPDFKAAAQDEIKRRAA